MSTCPVCDAEIAVIYEDRYDSSDCNFAENCLHCDYKHTYNDGLHTVHVQTINYTWLESDAISFYLCAAAVDAARNCLHAV